MTIFAYFKDRFLPEEECHISIHDRSFRFGDGVFETWLVSNGRIYDFAAHKRRLEQGLAALSISLDISHIEPLCKELIARNSLHNGYVRLVVSRGDSAGVVGYKPGGSPPYFVLQSVEKPYPVFGGISLYVCSRAVSLHVLSKTNNALIYTLAMLEAQEHGWDNALMLDAHGHICETASGNMFWVKNDVLYTPSTDLPFVPGTMRIKLLSLWEGKTLEGRFTLDALKDADELFMTNVGTIVAPVTTLQPMGIHLPVGAKTQRARELLDADILRDTAQ